MAASKYDHQAIEKKWQQSWVEAGVFRPPLPTGASRHPPSTPAAAERGGRSTYVLDMFPYPSADGLHVGHPEGYTATDIVSRYLRMKGMTVLHPMGWDAFGLPTENAAIQKKIHPRIVTEQNVKNFKRQIMSLGFSYDWGRELNTTDPKYYKWTQWIFLQLFKKGLAYEAELPIWWCPKDKTGLANEEVVGGVCDRCGTKVERKMLRQWVLRITAYAERLLKGLDKLNWPENIKALQRNWIGKSQGAEVVFGIKTPSAKKPQLFISTKNPAKKKRYVHMFAPLGVDIVTTDDLGKSVTDVEVEEGEDIKENALKKAQIFHQATGLPTLAIDEGLIIDTFPANQQPGSHVRRIPGFSGRPTDEDMSTYYINEVVKHGGESLVHWEHAIAYVDEFGAKETQIKVTSSKIVATKSKKVKDGYPLDSLLIDLKTGKYRSELTPKEDEAAIQPLTDALTRFVSGALSKSSQVTVFTTRPDTLFGATYLVLSPEHPLVDVITTPEKKPAVEKYKKEVASKSDLERTALEKEKTGVFTGAYAINPVNNEKIPVWIADYVLMSYGTGAIMAVPAHDERDYEFAKKHELPIREVIIPYRYYKPNPPRPGKKTVERRNIHPIVKNPRTGKFLALRWTKHPWVTFPMGGIDGNEDIVKAAEREVAEETGYTDLKFERVLGGQVKAEYFAAHKNENRVAYTQAVVFSLRSEKRIPVPEHELKEHEVIWLDPKELNSQVMVHAELDVWLHRLARDEHAYTGEGALINSGQFDGLTSEDGRKKIVEWLKTQGKAKPKVNYKLRDWVFSRQRYWGEPIPLVHCENCANIVQSTNYTLHFSDREIWGDLLSGKKTIETRALNPEEPERYFGNIKPGHATPESYIKGIFKPTGEVAYFRVKSVRIYKSLRKLFVDKKVHAKIWPDRTFKTLEELRQSHDELTPGNAAKIDKNGLIAFEIKHVLPGIIPLKEDELPLELPDVERYEPTGIGESPLAAINEWVNVKCRVCGHPAKRETNTMPQWAGSCWYYLRFTDPHNDTAMASPEAMKVWLPVDLYVGGAEHAVLHLLYARFWHMVLYDIGAIPKEVGGEPFLKLKNQGLILGPDGEKMSKSRGNVINPDDIVAKYGADTLRMYEMFMGPFEDAKPWDTNGIVGVRRFLDKVWRAAERLDNSKPNDRWHKYANMITRGIEEFRFNTCVSDLMKWVNEWGAKSVSKEEIEVFLKVLSPFAPHMAEELWQQLGHETMLVQESWPEFDPDLLRDDTVTIAVQVNGKHRGNVIVPTGSNESVVREAAQAEANVKKYLTSEPKKVIFVKDRLINFVV